MGSFRCLSRCLCVYGCLAARARLVLQPGPATAGYCGSRLSY
ncbi:hypothetical protein [Arthrobacter sp. DR-2P]|nr:hypothetical protein [Arthrobacter sp. DR-2P]